ncbi:MAG: hypothetical protein WCR78_10165 [Arcobacteraceae bacterium]|nr:hypothetical protein [Campylobacterales bacterium]
MYKKILNIFLIVLVFIYIIFEELIWEKFAKPIINLISSLHLFTKFIPKILALNSYIVLIFFVSIFVIVEIIGIYAGVLFISGHIITATFIYILKIPVAAFIFWFFNIAKPKLLEFRWFEFIYNHLISIIFRIKHSSIYIMIKENFFSVRSRLKYKVIYIYKLLKLKIKK